MRKILLFLGAMIAIASHAQTHKCTLPGGKIEYTDKPCAAGKDLTLPISTKPGPSDVDDWRWRARAYEQREAMRRAEEEAVYAARRAAVAATAAEEAAKQAAINDKRARDNQAERIRLQQQLQRESAMAGAMGNGLLDLSRSFDPVPAPRLRNCRVIGSNSVTRNFDMDCQ